MRIIIAAMALLSAISCPQAVLRNEAVHDTAKARPLAGEPRLMLLRSGQVIDCNTLMIRLHGVVIKDSDGRPVIIAQIRRRC